MLYFKGENMWPTVASLASMQFLRNIGLNKRKLSVMAFFNILLDSSNKSITLS